MIFYEHIFPYSLHEGNNVTSYLEPTFHDTSQQIEEVYPMHNDAVQETENSNNALEASQSPFNENTDSGNIELEAPNEGEQHEVPAIDP